MLSSSDAKFRCLWHLCVWSVLLTLVSQFLNVVDHIAFYIFGFLSVILLPVITSIYCNSSGKRGVRLLRVIYVLADPVLSCLTITPVLLLQHLPETLDQFYCLNAFTTWNKTLECFHDQSVPVLPEGHGAAMQLTKFRIMVIQACLVLPVLVSLSMGRRTTKMAYNTEFLNFAYWMIVAVEAASLVETAMLDHRYIHIVFTTEITISIVVVIANSYGLVTLVSFISPVSASLRRKYNTKFDLVYKVIVGIAAIFLAEVPFIAARFQIFILDRSMILPGTFYLWVVKDVIFIVIIVLVLGVKKLGKTYRRTCSPIMTKNNTYFQPEKRDVYCAKRVHFKTQEQDTASITGSYQFVMKKGTFSLVNKEVDRVEKPEQKKLCNLSTVQEEDETSSYTLDKMHASVDKKCQTNNPNTSGSDLWPTQGIYHRYSLNRPKKSDQYSVLVPINEQTPVSSVESIDGMYGSIDNTYSGSKDFTGTRSQVVVATIEKPDLEEDPEDMEVRMITQTKLPRFVPSAHM